MTEMKKINEMELENVAGGDRRIVNTGMKLDAVVRSRAGFEGSRTCSFLCIRLTQSEWRRLTAVCAWMRGIF